MSYIEFKDVVKQYQMGEVTITALDKTNFLIEKGELVVIVGPSGAGKTTALNILGGMDTATSGTVVIDGKDISKLKKKELDRAARKELKNKTTTKIRYVIAFLCFINFGILFVTKYFNFFGENINALFNALHIPAQIPFLNIFLPLGISFYTLSAISYVTDVARGVCKVERNYLRLLLFLIFYFWGISDVNTNSNSPPFMISS